MSLLQHLGVSQKRSYSDKDSLQLTEYCVKYFTCIMLLKLHNHPVITIHMLYI